MKTKKVKLIIFFTLLGLVALIITQFLIIRNSHIIETENTEVLKKVIKLKKENFYSNVLISLTKVRDKLISNNPEAKGIYLDPVQKIQPNYYVVSFYDTIPKELLQSYINEEFNNYFIKEEFTTGIYDCFTDSIIFDENIKTNISLKRANEEEDGHYFGVYFPNLKEEKISKNSSLPYSLLFASLILITAGIFAFYSISTILKQKKISKITYDFINNMTHELKTPISTISLSADVLLKSKELDKNRINRYLNIIKTENKRLESQVERVLQIAKLDKDVVKLNFESLDIHTIIETCIETFKIPIEQKKGNLSYNLNAKKHQIKGDIVHITNVIYNLLDNANKYSKSPPKINITTESTENEIKIVISDKGIGIKSEDIKSLFDKFYRVSTGDVHNVKGFGLGLYYVKQMVNKHEGEIKITSKINQGSKFTVILPLQKL